LSNFYERREFGAPLDVDAKGQGFEAFTLRFFFKKEGPMPFPMVLPYRMAGMPPAAAG
jgi:hypothetical protein